MAEPIPDEKWIVFEWQKLIIVSWNTQLASSAICSWERPIFCKVTRLFLVISADICSRNMKNSKARIIYIIIQKQPISFFHILYYLILHVSQNGLQHSNRASFISLSVKSLFTSLPLFTELEKSFWKISQNKQPKWVLILGHPESIIGWAILLVNALFWVALLSSW